MKNYYVKSHFYGWRAVSKEHFDRFVQHLRKNAVGIPADKREAYIQTRAKVEEAPCENC